MVIVCQHTPLVVTEFSDIYIDENLQTVMATPINCNEDYLYNLGRYSTVKRAKEVLYEIVNAYKEGLPVFEMPKE